MTIISRQDVFRLIGRPKLPTAEKFEAWVFEEVPPSIQKNGIFSVSLTDDSVSE